MKTEFLTRADVFERIPGAKINNGIVKNIDLDIIGHFGNLVTIHMPIEISGGGCCNPLNGFNSTISCGVYIRTLFDLFDISAEDGIRLSDIKNIPCRVIEENWHSKGIGNFMKDKFLMFDDFPKMYDEFMKQIKRGENE